MASRLRLRCSGPPVLLLSPLPYAHGSFRRSSLVPLAAGSPVLLDRLPPPPVRPVLAAAEAAPPPPTAAVRAAAADLPVPMVRPSRREAPPGGWVEEESTVVRPDARMAEGSRGLARMADAVRLLPPPLLLLLLPNVRVAPRSSLRLAPAPRIPDRVGAERNDCACGRCPGKVECEDAAVRR